MLFFRKLFRLPTPVDLGWSDMDALEDERWSPKPHGKTWQDWNRTVKEMHPVRYFLAETLADWLRYKVWFKIAVPLETLRYFLVSHLIPSRRYHMLDLRQPLHKDDAVNLDAYRYGWADVSDKMLYAMFNLLGEYLDKEMPADLTESYSDEEIKDSHHLSEQQGHLEEARAINLWWTVQRKKDHKRLDEIQSNWIDSKGNDIQYEYFYNEMRFLEVKLEEDEDEMIARLMKIRRSLWT